MGAPEAKVEQFLIKKCAERHWLCWKFTSPNLRGVPDRIIIADGLCAFVECKSQTGSLRAQQKLRIKNIEDHDVAVFVVHDEQSVENALSEIKRLCEKGKPDA